MTTKNATLSKLMIRLFAVGMIGFSSLSVQAQESVIETDSMELTFVADTALMAAIEDIPQQMAPKTFVPDPTRAVIYSAIFPGLGQIYNRKYWKLPLVYGAAVGCVYAITWNGTQYRGYKNAYHDLFDNNPDTNSWRDYNYRYYGGSDGQPETWSPSALSTFSTRLKNGKDNFRRNLELSYIISAGVYLLAMIDAYVDAQLFEFDISEDLSLRMEPVLFERTTASARSFGLQCSITF
jgi:hypothetical protein